MATKVVHVRKAPFDVYIGRSFMEFAESIWHNPFHLGPHRDGTRKEVLQKYKLHLLDNPWLLAHLHEVYNKTLGCWCEGVKTKKGCHGHIIAEIADAPDNKCLWCGSTEVVWRFAEPPHLAACQKHWGPFSGIALWRESDLYDNPEYNKTTLQAMEEDFAERLEKHRVSITG